MTIQKIGKWSGFTT